MVTAIRRPPRAPPSATGLPIIHCVSIRRASPAQCSPTHSTPLGHPRRPHAHGDGEKAPGEPQGPGRDEQARPRRRHVCRRHGWPAAVVDLGG